jgi:hypothetical protein
MGWDRVDGIGRWKADESSKSTSCKSTSKAGLRLSVGRTASLASRRAQSLRTACAGARRPPGAHGR